MGSGQMPRLLLRRKKRTSLLPQLARPSVSVSASRSRPSTLISASLRPLSSVVEEARVVVGEAKAEEDVVALQEVVAVATQELLEPGAKKSPDDHLSGANLYDKSLQTNDRSKSVCCGGSKMCSRFFENGQLNGTGDSILLPVTLVLSRACVLFSFSRQ